MMHHSDETGFTFIWRIENFLYCVEKKGEYLESPKFTICRGKTKKQSQFTLMLYPKGDCDESYIACYLRREPDDNKPHKLPVVFELSLKTPNGYFPPTQPQKKFFLQDKKYGFSKFIQRDEIFGCGKAYKFLIDDVLTVRCHIYEICGSFSPAGLWKALTRINVYRHFFTWYIEGFPSLEVDKKRIKNLIMPSFPELDLKMALFLMGKSTDQSRIKIEISMKSASHPIYSFLKMYVRDRSLNPKFIQEDEHWFNEDENNRTEVWHFPFNIERKKLMEREKENVLNNTLCLGFEFTFSFGVEIFKVEMVSDKLCEMENSMIHQGTVTLLSNLTESSNIFTNPKFCDAFLRVEDEDIPVYKVALCSQSPVFQAMFSNEMQEHENNIVDIIDFDKNIVRCFVNFVHSLPILQDLTGMDWINVMELYRIGHKYQVNKLMNCCAKYFDSNVNECNICSLLELTAISSDPVLKEIAQNFLSKLDSAFFRSEDWISFKKENVELTNEMLSFLFLKTKEESSC